MWKLSAADGGYVLPWGWGRGVKLRGKTFNWNQVESQKGVGGCLLKRGWRLDFHQPFRPFCAVRTRAIFFRFGGGGGNFFSISLDVVIAFARIVILTTLWLLMIAVRVWGWWIMVVDGAWSGEEGGCSACNLWSTLVGGCAPMCMFAHSSPKLQMQGVRPLWFAESCLNSWADLVVRSGLNLRAV